MNDNVKYSKKDMYAKTIEFHSTLLSLAVLNARPM